MTAGGRHADGRNEFVDITEPIIFDILGRDTLEEALIHGDEVHIGYTILDKLDLLADCSNHKLIPNPTHPDQPVTKVKFAAAYNREVASAKASHAKPHEGLSHVADSDHQSSSRPTTAAAPGLSGQRASLFANG